MAEQIIGMRQREDTTANWEAVDPVLRSSEIGVVTDGPGTGRRFKIGDGITPWSGLPFAAYDEAALDEGTADNINTPGSATENALNASYGSLSVREHGAYGNGIHDDTAAIQATIAAGVAAGLSGVWLPPGVYNITAPITVPYNTVQPFGLFLAAGARIVARATMSSLVTFGSSDAGAGSAREMFSLRGGYWDGAGLADMAIHLTSKMTGFILSDIVMDSPISYGIKMDLPDTTASHDALISNVRMNNVHSGGTVTTWGIYAEGGDWQLSGFYAAKCLTFIHSAGAMHVNNIHVFNNATAVPVSTGIRCWGELVGGELYLDTLTTGITQKKDDGTYSRKSLLLSNVFYYRYTSAANPVSVFEIHYQSDFRVTNAWYGGGISSDDAAMIRPHLDDGTPTSVLWNDYSLNVMPGPSIADCARMGSSRNTRSVDLITQNAHVAGQGVLIGYIPPPTSDATNRRQIVRLTQRGTVPTQEFDLTFSFSGGVPTTILNPDVEPSVVSNALGLRRRRGMVTANGTTLYFGIKAAVTVNGALYYPLYLYNTDTSGGGMGGVYAELVGLGNGIIFWPFKAWESGLTEGSFILTTRPATLPVATAITVQAAAGVGATVTSLDASDAAGQIQITTGTSPTSGNMVWVAFGETYPAAPRVVVSAGDVNAASKQPYVTGRTTSGFFIAFNSTPAASTSYYVVYHASGGGGTTI